MAARMFFGSLILFIAGAIGVASHQNAPGIASGVAPAQPVLADDFFTVDGAHSSLLFRVRHFEVANFWGRVNKPKGQFRIKDDALDKSFININVELKNMDAGSDSRNALLVGPDFFNARENPTASFSSKSIRKLEDGVYEATGDFTMRGVTKTITVRIDEYTEVQTTRFGFRGGFECVFTVNRSDYGMDMFVEEKTLGDSVRITVAIEGVQR